MRVYYKCCTLILQHKNVQHINAKKPIDLKSTDLKCYIKL